MQPGNSMVYFENYRQYWEVLEVKVQVIFFFKSCNNLVNMVFFCTMFMNILDGILKSFYSIGISPQKYLEFHLCFSNIKTMDSTFNVFPSVCVFS